MFFLPIGDEPNNHVRTPFVTWGLIGLNVLVFLLTMQHISGITPENRAFVDQWGYVPDQPRLGALFTHMFLHTGWLHLFGNMLFLWIFGDNVESRLGHLGFLGAYLGTGLVAVLAHAVFVGGGLPVVGASGAVCGVQGLYLVACPGARIRVLFWLYIFIRVFLVPAWIVVSVYFVLNDLVPVLMGTRDNVAHWAHLGGLAAGLLTMLLLAPILGRNEPPPRPPLEARYPHRSYRYQADPRRRGGDDDSF